MNFNTRQTNKQTLALTVLAVVIKGSLTNWDILQFNTVFLSVSSLFRWPWACEEDMDN